MLKTSGSPESLTQPGKGRVGVGGDNRARRDKNKLDDDEVDGGEVEYNEVGKKVQKTSRSKNLSKYKEIVGSNAFTLGARLVFTKLRQAFLKALIFHYFNSKYHIWIEIDVSGYIIDEVLSQLTLDDLGRWYLMAFFSQKMILAVIKYETHDDELLVIVEVFKTWRYYLKSFQYEVLVLTNYNIFWRFIDTKSLSSKQVYRAQKLLSYHFWINYCQGKANGAANTLFRYSQWSAEEEKTLCAENIIILYRLQSSLAKVSGLLTSQLSLLYQIIICKTTVLPN